MGKILMLEGLGHEYLDVIQAAELNELPLVDCEERLLGFDHAHVGGLVAGHWGLPSAVGEAIQFHHGPKEAERADPVVNLLAQANRLVHEVERQDLEAAAAVFDDDVRRALGLRPTDVEAAIEQVVEILGTVEV